MVALTRRVHVWVYLGNRDGQSIINLADSIWLVCVTETIPTQAMFKCSQPSPIMSLHHIRKAITFMSPVIAIAIILLLLLLLLFLLLLFPVANA